MLEIKTRKIVAIVASAAAALSIAAPLATAGGAAMKLEGAWVAKLQGIPGQWSYVLSPDASGRRAAFHGSIDVSFGNPCNSDRSTPLLGSAVMTGPDTAKFNSVWYGIKDGAVVCIGTNTGEFTLVQPGESVGTHHFAFYWTSADADGDGFPDPGAQPFYQPPPLTSIDTRLPYPE